MARKLPPKDVVIIGLGWTGSILGHELAKAGLDVVAIERGPWRDTATDFPPAYAQDELRYAVRLDLFLRPDQETLTFRNNMSQTALPIRSFVSFPLASRVRTRMSLPLRVARCWIHATIASPRGLSATAAAG